ncbi:MAG: MATE family efflux transporter [Phycisphaerales bacterium]|nr:MATE family efflux transporter [Phycisphaerales bacterium]MCB9854776.1 MATE family efflux transporter [Phycisphaerales bacterium]MCB9863752.1 MATE family efflux transporter [Phycisphaerales bacterium]
MTEANTLQLQPGVTADPTTGQEIRKLLILAGPNVLLMVTRMLMGFVDFTMVSHLGTAATAAISPATILVFNVMVLGMGLATSAQTFAAQCLGRGDRRKGVAYAWQTIYFALLFLILSAPMSLASTAIWNWLGSEPAVARHAADYCRIAFWCMGPAIVAFGFEGFFNGIQRPRVALASAIVALGVNIVVNYALIDGHWGFPALGIQGAAYATVFAWIVRAGICVGVLFTKELREEYGSLEGWRYHAKYIRDYLKVGWPTSIQFLLDVGAWFVVLTFIIGQFGDEAMAASNIGFQCLHLAFMPAFGIGIGTSALIGHAIGEGRHALAERRARLGVTVTALFMGAIAVVFYFGRFWLPTFFNTNPKVVALAAQVLFWAATYQVFDAFGIVYSFALRGAADTRWPAIAVIASCWGLMVGGGYVVSHAFPNFGINGPWVMCTLHISLMGLLMWLRFKRGAWKKIDLFKDHEDARPVHFDDADIHVDEERVAESPCPPVYAALQPDAALHLAGDGINLNELSETDK